MTDDGATGQSPETLTYDEWATALRDGTILGQRCPDCAHETATPKAACARCGSRNLEAISLPTAGTIYSETTIGVGPESLDTPYRLAVVSLGRARVLGRLEGDGTIGDSVELIGVVEQNGDPAPLFGPE